jgi:hypothetical protein
LQIAVNRFVHNSRNMHRGQVVCGSRRVNLKCLPDIKTLLVAPRSLQVLAADLNATHLDGARAGRVSAAQGQRLAARLKKYVRAKAAAKEWDAFFPDHLARSPQFKWPVAFRAGPIPDRIVGNFKTPLADLIDTGFFVRSWGKNGRHLLMLSVSEFDP